MLLQKENIRCIKCSSNIEVYSYNGRPLMGIIAKCECGCNQVYINNYMEGIMWREVE